MVLSFSQTHAQFEEVKKAAVNALSVIFPVEGKQRKIVMEKAWAEDSLDPTDYQSQAKAKAAEGTWGVPVYAHLKLLDTKGQVIDEAPKVKLFSLPKPTQRHSYIVGGNEYQVHNQLRLKSGVYTIKKQNGELKTQVNLARGKNFDLGFDENKGLFSIQKVGGGQANIPLYPVLLYLGLSKAEVEKQWGARLAQTNEMQADPRAVQRLEAAFGVKRGQELKDYLGQTQIDPATTKVVLGKAFEKVDGLMLLAASKNLLDVHLGKEAPTDRDSLEFKELHGIDDFLRERLEKNSQALSFRVKRNVDNLKRTKLSQIVSSGAFSSAIESFFTQDDKAATPEQTNPLEMLSGTQKVTIMGAGGIGTTHAVTPEMRQIHPSHFGLVDPVHTPESDRIGANLHLPIGAVKDGKHLKMTVIDKQGKEHFLDPIVLREKKVVLPDQKGARVKAFFRGAVVEIDRSEADYFAPTPNHLFSWSTNLIPFLPSAQGNRAMMAAKMMEQAISLKNREAPLVQSDARAGGATMEQLVGKQAAVVATADGTVKKITDNEMVVTTAQGDVTYNLYNNFALNRKSFIHNDPVVKVGDAVKKGQVIADSNYTRNGVLALGANLRTAYIPYKGLNFDDGIVISESAADRLTSEHIYKKELPMHDTVLIGLDRFRVFYPNAVSPDNAAKLDTDGVIRKGQKVKYGEVFVTALQKRVASAEVGLVSRTLSERPKDISLVWTLEDEGTVLDVIKSGKKITVVIKTEEKAKIGDKLAGRHGNKGVITKIIPDTEMPADKEGKPVEILLNPMGIISRINVSQTYESAAAKAAAKAGQPFVVSNFENKNYLQEVKKTLDKAGVSDKEELFDPVTGKSLGQVHVGQPHILKLFKQSQGNYSVRQGGPGHGYDANLQPLKAGGEEGAKSLDVLTMYSMLSHGARENLREMAAIKSTKNDEFWKALKAGEQLPPPQPSFAYEKFLGYLKGAGVDVKKNGTQMMLAPFTDAQVRDLSNSEVKKPLFYRAKDMEPIKGGFFDPLKLGGFKGNKWGHVELSEPVINPPFENAVRKLTGLGTKFDDVMSGKLHIDPQSGALNTDGQGVTGGAAIEHMLKGIDVDAQIADLEAKAKKARASQLDDINKKLRYLYALKKTGLKPEEAYIRRALPVVPAQFRPIYPLPDGNVTTSDVNIIYQNTGILNTMMKLPVMDLLEEKEKSNIRKDLYEHVKGVSGLVDLNIKGKEREGFISAIKGGAGGQPKEGYFISKLLSKRQDYVGRGTIIPEPSLGIDEMAMPEPMAWKLFEPFVVRELRALGKTPLQAMEEIKNKSPLAKRALEIVMEKRHVFLNRAPSLHKYSIMAFKPRLTEGKSIKIQPLVNKGFNADYDGDTMTIHVPITEAANQEAAKMTPSRNLFQPGSGKLMITPSQEAQIGIFYLSKSDEGRKRLNAITGPRFPVTAVLTKGEAGKFLTRIAQEASPQEFAEIVHKLKSEGEKHAYEIGFTLGVNDLVDFSKEREKVVAEAKKLIGTADDPMKVSKTLNGAIDEMLAKKLKDTNNPLFDMIESGARGDKSQLRSILVTPLFVADARNNIVKNPISKSYAEGLDLGDYWTSMYGARKGMMDRAIQTSLPGAFSKDIMAMTIDNVISALDCGTQDGILLPIDNADCLDRYLAGEQHGTPHNTLVDHALVAKLKKVGALSLKVRTPLKCRATKGTCAHCYGQDEHGHLPEVGENVGAKSGQTISEPLVQITMNSFHTGGAAGTGAQAQGFARINQLLQLPKVLAGAAPLAPVAGKVSKITKGLAGGFDVVIGSSKVHIPQGRNPVVQVGAEVQKGDRLSDGPIKPQDLAALKGVEHAQDYITSELQNEYKSQGVGINRKTFETVVKSLTNTTQVVNQPRHGEFLPGDVISHSVAVDYNANRKMTVSVDEAEGYELAEQVAGIPVGTDLTQAHLDRIKRSGVRQISVLKEELKHQPFVKGMSTLPLLKQDWMAALGYRNLSKVLTEGAAQGWQTDLEGYHPVPALAHGSNFGHGKDGKY